MTDNGYEFCCESLTDTRRRVLDHVREGTNHGVIQTQIEGLRSEVGGLRKALERDVASLRRDIERVEASLASNQNRLYLVMGGVGVLSTLLSFLGVDGIGRIFAIAGP